MQFTVKAATLALAGLSLAACGGTTPSQQAGDGPTESSSLTVVTHESFNLPDELKAKFAEDTGYDVEYVAPGDAGALVNQLVLTKDSPLGDVVYGIDNTFASRAHDEGVIQDYEPAAAPEIADDLNAPGLTAIDFGDVCINADLTWFADQDLALPETLDDLTRPEYKDLLVVTHPASSSPGLAFLAATVSEKGDGYLDYWRDLTANGVKVVSSWTEAYYTDFSGADGQGPRPLVLSYATSPAYTVDGDESRTTALLDTCTRQVEYAGVLEGAQNEVGAQKFIDFLLTEEVQASIPENMYMYPAVTNTPLPEEWVSFAPLADDPIDVPQADVTEHREEWIREWSEAIR